MTVHEKIRKIVTNPILYIQNFMKVVNKNGKLVKFILNPQQKYLLKNLDKYNIVLKSRQLGITTLSCAYSIYLAITNPYTTCLLMSYSIDSATGIFEKLKQLYFNIPKSLQVPLIANNRKELKLVNGSRIIVATCGNKDVARGLTIKFAHLSEVGFMKDTIEKQLLAIEQALTPDGIIILESTANGLNYFSDLWNKAERKENLYKPFFFSWINDKVMFAEEYKQFADRYISIHGSLPIDKELTGIEKGLRSQGATIEQLVWRRLKIANSSEEAFAQEFPSNPVEAFISTGSNIFSPKLIHERLEHIHEVKPIKSKPNGIPVSLIPWFGRELTIWECPKNGQKYYIGVDTSEGIGKDFSAFHVLTQDAKQVAEFKSNKIKPFQFAEIVNDIGIYYNKALLVVEKASAGHTVVDKLKNDYKYSNLYKYKDYDARGRTVRRPGFVTNPKTKPIMINDFVELFETNQLVINSKDLLSEMKMFQFKDGKMEATTGYHDDLVMSFAMAIQGIKSGINYL
ncbi:Terminase-like family protein [Ruminococcaceae bacterium BL-6]|nr:Terminase-like family protein [Ruminococcaceae bacterium BL-6]